MKKIYIVFGLLAASSLYTFGQRADSLPRRKRVSKTSIQLVYSHYLQNGNHSAVTGGEGTEKLTVYSPDITLTHQADSLNSYSIHTGVDVISSASTDNIDFIMSSASRIDNHAYIDVTYNRNSRNKKMLYSGSGYFSIESDYLSAGFGLSAIHTSSNKSREISATFEAFFDDLRWGRLSGERHLKLVYPQELRNRNWFTNYRRQSFNLNLGFRQTINKKMLLAIFPGITYQHGLLATPFHRVYFKDSSARVENLPDKRIKIPVGIQLNAFIGNRVVLRSYYRFYWDDFGIVAHTAEIETAVKITPALMITPSFRFYTQEGASFFRPIRAHDIQEAFYTSDYDLSDFQSYESGLALHLSGLDKKPGAIFSKAGLRYAYYKRTDGLYAHTVTLLTELVVSPAR